MKILLIGINSKFIHSNLAIRYIEKVTKDFTNHHVNRLEYTIHTPIRSLIYDSNLGNYDLIAISTYIWNGLYVLDLIKDIKILFPHIKIILGGPEAFTCLSRYINYCDGIIMGEGETPFLSIINNLDYPEKWIGVSTKEYKAEIFREDNLEMMNHPFSSIDLKKINYYETQRGCPLRCSYCLSSRFTGVRYKDINIVKKELDVFFSLNINLVKFIDRTFNSKIERAVEIIEYIKENDNGKTSFHFEISPAGINDKLIDSLKNARKNLFQYEIGIQSTNDNVNIAIQRPIKYNRVKNNIRKLISYKNCHSHLDLIVGLPYSSYDNIRKSFNDLFDLEPDFIQLGFLKLLPGTPLFNEKDNYNIVSSNMPPYEIYRTDLLSFDMVKKLKLMEKMLDYYNKYSIKYTFNYIISIMDAFSFYESIAEFFPKEKRYNLISYENKLDILAKWGTNIIREYLEIDYSLKRRNKRFLIFNDRRIKNVGNKSYFRTKIYKGEYSDNFYIYSVDYDANRVIFHERDFNEENISIS